jgi:ATP-dependent DNA ligase
MQAQEEFAKSGYEGFVVRDALAPYVRKRSTQMMKFKPRKEDLYEIVGTVEEVSIQGISKDSLGALICRGDDGTLFNVGSGSLLTREARQTYWKSRDTLIGKYARVKYQHLTHARGVPRFPVVVEILDDPLCSNFEQREA